MTFNVRPLQATDLPEVGKLFDLYRQFYGQPSDLQLAHQYVCDRFTRGESVVLVAQLPNGEAAGFCQMYPSFCSVEAAPIYALYDLFVKPSERRTGAGRQLLLAAVDRAAADGKVRMDLTTAKTNLNAQLLYESLGWARDSGFISYVRRVETPDAAAPVSAMMSL